MIAIYVRVSTAEQAKEGYSIEEQTERLKKYCEAQGRTDYAVYTDAGMSGANMDRSGLKSVIQDAKAGKLDKVIVYKLDRLSRSQKDTLWLIEDAFMSHGVDFESITERFDTATSFGRAMVGILAVFAQLEREQIRERVMLGREGRAKSGKYYCSGKKPTGYDIKDKELYINEYEAQQIREAFERYAGGEGVRAILESFNGKGYTTKNGSWNVATLYHVLGNPLYKGIIKSNGAEYQGIHEPIVSEALFEAAQRARNRGSKKGESWSANNMLLGGLVWCKRCGARFCAHSVKAGEKRYGYYICHSVRKSTPSMIKDASCQNKQYSAKKLEEIVLGEICKLEIDGDYIRQLSSAGNGAQDTAAKIKALRLEYEKVSKQMNRLVDLYTLGDIDINAVNDRAIALNKQRTALMVQIQGLEDKKPKLTPKRATQMVKGFADLLAQGNHAEVVAIINELIDRIEIDGEDIYIYWSFI